MPDFDHKRYPIDKGWQVLLRDLGISTQDVLRQARLPLDLMSKKSPTVTADEYYAVWQALGYLLREEPTFPLQMAQALTVEAFSPPLFACICSRDLNMALARISKYKLLVGPLRIEIQQDAEHTVIAFTGLPENSPPPSSLIAFEMAFWVVVARLTTREHIIPLAVHTTIQLPESDTYERFFGVRFTHDTFSGLTFSAKDATRPFLTANDTMWSIFEPELRQRLHDLTQESSFRERVRACLVEILASGQYAMADVAARLAISNRTLQRRLRQEGTTFQNVLDELREELARHYLASSDYTSGQIAFLLGYEEPNSFFRAFRAWTGTTPEVIRSGSLGAGIQQNPIQ